MNYCQISFDYKGPYDGLTCMSREANKALCNAEAEVEKVLAGMEGVEFVHAYSWPDGSLYKYVRTEQPMDLFEEKLRAAFPGPSPKIESIHVYLEGHTTHREMTLEEEFERKLKYSSVEAPQP